MRSHTTDNKMIVQLYSNYYKYRNVVCLSHGANFEQQAQDGWLGKSFWPKMISYTLDWCVVDLTPWKLWIPCDQNAIMSCYQSNLLS